MLGKYPYASRPYIPNFFQFKIQQWYYWDWILFCNWFYVDWLIMDRFMVLVPILNPWTSVRKWFALWKRPRKDRGQGRPFLDVRGRRHLGRGRGRRRRPVKSDNRSFGIIFLFSVPDLFDVCIERCQRDQLECIISCDNDLMCISQCILEVTSCIESKLN